MKNHEDKKKAAGTGAGAVVGAAAGGVAGGAAAGAAVGGMTGPVGAAVGAAVGAVIGAVAGRGGAAATDTHGHATTTGITGAGEGRGMHTALGAFADKSAAERAVERLAEAGFARHDIHLQHQHGEHAGFFPGIFGVETGPDGSLQRHPHAMHASTYDEAVRRGNAVVIVDAGDAAQAERASALMQELGALDIDESSRQWRTEGWKPAHEGVAGEDISAIGERGGKLDVVQEELEVGKRMTERGGVRIVQRMSQQPVREIVRLREERAMVERRPVDRPASPEDLNTFREGSVEIRERAEVPVVGKTARVVEEVAVAKDVREREETIEDTVRRKDVDVHRLEGDRTTRDERAFATDVNREQRLREEQERASLGRSPMDPDKPR